MHETHEVHELIRQALQLANYRHRIKRLQIIVGEASGYSPDHIAHHLTGAARGTLAEGAQLDFVMEPLTAQCASCQEAFAGDQFALRCPACGSTELKITAGQDLRLAEVELER
jgi:hydrogenase nickel incorporation protein HypA/HybF